MPAGIHGGGCTRNRQDASPPAGEASTLRGPGIGWAAGNFRRRATTDDVRDRRAVLSSIKKFQRWPGANFLRPIGYVSAVTEMARRPD
jgi:hypothetical protein